MPELPITMAFPASVSYVCCFSSFLNTLPISRKNKIVGIVICFENRINANFNYNFGKYPKIRTHIVLKVMSVFVASIFAVLFTIADSKIVLKNFTKLIDIEFTTESKYFRCKRSIIRNTNGIYPLGLNHHQRNKQKTLETVVVLILIWQNAFVRCVFFLSLFSTHEENALR